MMKHIIHKPSSEGSYPTALLIKSTALSKPEIERNYIEPLKELGVDANKIISFSLEYNEKGKCPVKLIRQYLASLLPALKSLNVQYLLVADVAYFKTLTGKRKAEPHYGYILPCAIKGFEEFKVILSVNYGALFYNPNQRDKLQMSLETMVNDAKGQYKELGHNIIHFGEYPDTVQAIRKWLKKLRQYPELTCDIETFSLRIGTAGLGTISFAWNEHEGIAFEVDFLSPINRLFVRVLLRRFFLNYKGKLIFHGGTFDIKMLIFTLFMKKALDTKGMLLGLKTLTRNIDDTKIITYLAKNSTARQSLSLKDNSFEYTGNYAIESIKDITKVPRAELLKYNLIDSLATWYVFKKNYPIMVADNQLEIYKTIMRPNMRVIIQMELVGMPLNMEKVYEVKYELEATLAKKKTLLYQSKIIEDFTWILRQQEMQAANAKLKVKVKPLSDFDDVKFNPASPKQLQQLFYEFLGFEVIDKTNTGLPATGAKTIKKLLKTLKDNSETEEIKKVLTLIREISEADKILTTFVSAFINKSVLKEDGYYYLHGNFNIGPVSGRLSSSDPNLQNLPSTGTIYAKMIKECFIAPPGWLLSGADFSSLEDKISALTTKDPNKLKVYTGIVIYELTIDGVIHYIREDSTIEYDGKTYSGEEFYGAYTNGLL